MNKEKYTLQEVTTPALEREWLDFPKRIYKGNRNWVCPLDVDVLEVFNPSKNELFADGEAIRWASSEGIAGGYGDKRFGPDDTITREQLAAILHRYARAYGGDLSHTGDLSAFTDQNLVSEYAREAMTWAVDKGILTGVEQGIIGGETTSTTLDPQGEVTRAQVAVMLQKFCQLEL